MRCGRWPQRSSTMSALSDAIREYGPDNLAKVLTEQAHTHAGYRFFNLLYTEPSQIARACDRLGFTELPSFMAWADKVRDNLGAQVGAIEALIDPPIGVDLSACPTVEFPEIHKAMTEQATLRDDFFVDQTDRTYRLPTKAQWDKLAWSYPGGTKRWVETDNDCDDFANGFRGWLAMQGMGNLANGFCGITPYDSAGEIIGGHAVVLVMDSDKKIWFLDPKEGKLYPPTKASLGSYFFAASVKIARAYF